MLGDGVAKSRCVWRPYATHTKHTRECSSPMARPTVNSFFTIPAGFLQRWRYLFLADVAGPKLRLTCVGEPIPLVLSWLGCVIFLYSSVHGDFFADLTHISSGRYNTRHCLDRRNVKATLRQEVDSIEKNIAPYLKHGRTFGNEHRDSKAHYRLNHFQSNQQDNKYKPLVSYLHIQGEWLMQMHI